MSESKFGKSTNIENETPQSAPDVSNGGAVNQKKTWSQWWTALRWYQFGWVSIVLVIVVILILVVLIFVKVDSLVNPLTAPELEQIIERAVAQYATKHPSTPDLFGRHTTPFGQAHSPAAGISAARRVQHELLILPIWAQTGRETAPVEWVTANALQYEVQDCFQEMNALLAGGVAPSDVVHYAVTEISVLRRIAETELDHYEHLPASRLYMRQTLPMILSITEIEAIIRAGGPLPIPKSLALHPGHMRNLPGVPASGFVEWRMAPAETPIDYLVANLLHSALQARLREWHDSGAMGRRTKGIVAATAELQIVQRFCSTLQRLFPNSRYLARAQACLLQVGPAEIQVWFERGEPLSELLLRETALAF